VIAVPGFPGSYLSRNSRIFPVQNSGNFIQCNELNAEYEWRSSIAAANQAIVTGHVVS